MFVVLVLSLCVFADAPPPPLLLPFAASCCTPQIKLKLDAVVVQQGRLADRSKALSKEDMLEMIQHGAVSVFRTGDGDDDTDDVDIDAILAAGEKKTKELEAQVQALGDKGEEVSVVVGGRNLNG